MKVFFSQATQKGPRVQWEGPVHKVTGIQLEYGSVVKHKASMCKALCLILSYTSSLQGLDSSDPVCPLAVCPRLVHWPP